MKKLIVFISFIFFNFCFSQADCDCYKKYGVKVTLEVDDWCIYDEKMFKNMEAFFDCMCACQKNNQLLSNINDSKVLEDKTHIFGDYKDSDNLTLQYDGNITYKVKFNNGISITPEIEKLSINNIEYQGKIIPKKILDSLNVNFTDHGSILINGGKININSSFKFYKGFDFNTTIDDIDFQSIDRLYNTSSTSFKQQDINHLSEKLFIKNPTEFYDLDVEALYDKITYFDVPLLEKIKIAMDRNKSEAEILKKKQKEVKALTPNNKLSLEQLKRKLQLLKDLVAGGIIHCITFESCNKDIKDIEDEILKREKDSNIADIISEIKNLNPNPSLSIEQLKKKRKLLEDLKNIDECKTYKICDSDIKNVQDEIEKRFDASSMTKEECIDWLNGFIKNNTSFNKIKINEYTFMIETDKIYNTKASSIGNVVYGSGGTMTGFYQLHLNKRILEVDSKNTDEIIEYFNAENFDYIPNYDDTHEELNFLRINKNKEKPEKIFNVLLRLYSFQK